MRIALAGNPNSGKTTLFNALTGSNQYVGNWPGVTVEKKSGYYRKDKSNQVEIIDLPGVYSLSPYTLEEVVTRDFLIRETPDVIIDIIDATNIERNLYLATQLSEIGIPLVLALNMMDLVKANKDQINISQLEQSLGCRVVEISALHKKNLDELIEVAQFEAKKKKGQCIESFSEDLESHLKEIENSISSLKNNPKARWFAIKIAERDEKALVSLKMSPEEKEKVETLIADLEEKRDDDAESIIVSDRYDYIHHVVQKSVRKGRLGLTTTDKIDKIVTNRWLALPIFAVLMTVMYLIVVKVIGGPFHDWWADEIMGDGLTSVFESWLSHIEVAPWLNSLIIQGAVAGVGAVLGFLPLILALQFFVALLEDVGYMARVAFILDRAFRRFGLSGKSFIPILIGTGCSVPGITATRTIENENDRKMTIILASFMPCGAKLDIIALFSAVLLHRWWLAPLTYLIGIMAVIVSGLILKKTKPFAGEPAPFVMELPSYHVPKLSNIIRVTWDRIKQFLIKAGTIIFIASIAIWALQSLGFENGHFAYLGEESEGTALLTYIGDFIAPIFAPLGFGNGPSAIASLTGLVAKEVVVSTFGVISTIGEDANAVDLTAYLVNSLGFTSITALSFLIFNQLTVPCFAAVGAIREEMRDKRWFWLAVIYQIVFSYLTAMMFYQFGIVLVGGQPFTIWTAVALVVLALFLYLIFRPDPYKGKAYSKRAVEI